MVWFVFFPNEQQLVITGCYYQRNSENAPFHSVSRGFLRRTGLKVHVFRLSKKNLFIAPHKGNGRFRLQYSIHSPVMKAGRNVWGAKFAFKIKRGENCEWEKFSTRDADWSLIFRLDYFMNFMTRILTLPYLFF